MDPSAGQHATLSDPSSPARTEDSLLEADAPVKIECNPRISLCYDNYPNYEYGGLVADYQVGVDNRLGSASISTNTSLVVFPAVIYGYLQQSQPHLKFHLGPSTDQKLFTVVEHPGLTSNTLIELFDMRVIGFDPTDDEDWSRREQHQPAVIGRLDRNNSIGRFTGSYLNIVIPHERPTSKVAEENVVWFNVATRGFVVHVGDTTEEQQFCWRRARGGDWATALSGASMMFGWELTRTDGDDAGDVLAVVCYNASISWTNAFVVAFFGPGLTGALGRDWEVATVISALWFWVGLRSSDVMHRAAMSV
ncbi:hypothetical protein GGTG_08575 [Gaeumannomyces tritici R3-111a-1]|uniref:Uncharacterized protein n=1 Tax=Gaeumannomyces tritici (strain R3-111a-1) TaxID=644352 RepID=J3P4Y9_GAET3|nr:hypothetical protein GGTG_08575 [Gaeumannomyces tritici R3-111a-1]EJT74737.1 hypothetical protein GGTG_08575 [Gaeumannomyces tritici R3-111a-1]